MERIAQAFGTLVGGVTLDFVVPATAKDGDQLVILLVGRPATQTDLGSLSATCAGWTRELAEKFVNNYYNEGVLLSKACAGDAGLTVSVAVTTLAGANAAIGGVLVVYRGGVLPALAERVDSVKGIDYTTAINHISLSTEGTQHDDRRLSVWYVKDTGADTIAPPATGGAITSLGQVQGASWDVAAAEYLHGAIGTAGAMTVVASSSRGGANVSACLRARAVARPVGVSTPQPGAIGLMPGGA